MADTRDGDGNDPALLPATYAAALRAPGMARVVTSMVLSRLGNEMWNVLIVLFALRRFDSTIVAGVAAAAGDLPGKFLALIGGALLDRHGRARIVVIDYTIVGLCILSIAVISIAGGLTAPIYVAICAVSSLTNVLSSAGLRSLFPVLLPRHLWDRGNALDSAAYVLAGLGGPALAGVLVSIGRGDIALIAAAVPFGAAALAGMGVPDPPSTAPQRSLISDARAGIAYVVKNRTLRGLAISLSSINFGVSAIFVVLPVTVTGKLGGSPATVGLILVAMSVAGLISGAVCGRIGSEGRERLLMGVGIVLTAAAMTLLAFAGSIAMIVVLFLLVGIANGSVDIGLFALRQRRSDPMLLGRVMAITMAFNSLLAPAGSLTAGILGPTRTTVACLVAAAVTLVGGLSVVVTVRGDD